MAEAKESQEIQIQLQSQNVHQETQEEVAHEPTIFAEPIFQIGNFQITNSLFSSILVTLTLVVTFIFVRTKIRQIPKGLQNFFEMILEFGLNFTDSITQDRKLSEKLLPVVLALFMFILLNNWFGLLPIIGTIGFYEMHDGHNVFIPFFRGGTADLNLTLALALFAVIFSHLLGVFTIGAWKHFNKFINFEALLEIPKKFKKDKNVAFLNPVKFFVGLMEVVGEIAKIMSLSLRLFGNIFAGEVLLASMATIFAFMLPIPFVFLEVLVGMVQAAVFSILTLVFLSMSVTAEH
ncbi:MAG: F0F1 ATP synthase subunit A [Candidatus Moranbacteria bacterium]|nr:F0F1 ATP synthase subunit A [Candidatus Moranbacteria bacterium]